jgi:hypothetical protein
MANQRWAMLDFDQPRLVYSNLGGRTVIGR